MQSPEISIIIPVYQHAKTLPRCLETLFAQTFSDAEIIIVDDGSTDNPKEAVARFLPKVTFLSQKNMGANRARNYGFTHAKGKYVLFCDADVLAKKNMLSVMRNALIRDQKAAYAYSAFKFGWKVFRLWPFDAKLLKKRNYITTMSLIRREVFPGFDEKIKRFQDWDLWLSILEQGGYGTYIPEVLFTVLPRREGMSQWIPRIAYRLPWKKFGIRIRSVEKFLEAEQIIKEKHHLL